MSDEVSAEARQHINSFNDDNPFLKLLGVRATSIEYGKVRLDMKIGHELTNLYGIAHGGVTVTLADTAMGASCFSMGRQVVTLGMSLSFLRAISEEDSAYAIGEVIHSGRHTMVCEGRVYDGRDELCVKTEGMFSVIGEF